MLWTKGAHQLASFQTFTARMEINQIPYVILQVMSHFSFKSCITLKCHDICHIMCFGQKGSIKVQFFRLLSALWKVYPTSCHF